MSVLPTRSRVYPERDCFFLSSVQNSRRNLRTYFIAVNCFQRGKTRGAVSTMVEVTEGAGKGADPSNTSKTTMDYKTEWMLTGETAFLGSLECAHNTRAWRREMAPPQQSTKHSLLDTITDKDNVYAYSYILTLD